MPLTDKELSKVWGLVKIALNKEFSQKQYKAWIEKSTKLLDFEGNQVVVAVPNNIVLKWLSTNAKFKIAKALSELLGTDVLVDFKISPASFKRIKKEENQDLVSLFDPTAKYSEQVKKALEEAQINPKYSFENFIVGASSQLAYAAAVAVAESLGDVYNPLFIYGPVGVGKTHLMQAVAHKAISKDPTKKVYYCSSETFLNEMVDSIRKGKAIDFRNQYRKLDLLLIDDIQFISNWQSTQDELFHTFNTLYNAGKQIIFVSDRPPAEINNLADRLKSRFEGGMVVDILPPDFETRVAILRKYNETKHYKLSDEAIEKIALLVTDNVRSLIGAYNKAHSYVKLTKSDLKPEDIERMLGLDKASLKRRLTPKKIVSVVASFFGVLEKDVMSSKRSASVVLPRQLSMYLIRTLLHLSLEETARALNRKDHTTVLHAVSKIEKLMQQDSNFSAEVLRIKGKLVN